MIYIATDAFASQLETLRPVAQRRDVTLETFVPANLHVEGDPNLVSRVIDTLLHAALNHACAHDKITLTAQSPFNKLTVDIMLKCAKPVTTAREVEKEVEIITPLLQSLRMKLLITNPTEKSLLFHFAV